MLTSSWHHQDIIRISTGHHPDIILTSCSPLSYDLIPWHPWPQPYFFLNSFLLNWSPATNLLVIPCWLLTEMFQFIVEWTQSVLIRTLVDLILIFFFIILNHTMASSLRTSSWLHCELIWTHHGLILTSTRPLLTFILTSFWPHPYLYIYPYLQY
jgi:hypothetical protein